MRWYWKWCVKHVPCFWHFFCMSSSCEAIPTISHLLPDQKHSDPTTSSNDITLLVAMKPVKPEWKRIVWINMATLRVDYLLGKQNTVCFVTGRSTLVSFAHLSLYRISFSYCRLLSYRTLFKDSESCHLQLRTSLPPIVTAGSYSIISTQYKTIKVMHSWTQVP